jgi:hypothetical protein
MKMFLLVTALFVFAINASAQRSVFLRVFDANGSKIGKGKLVGVTDSSIILTATEVPYTRIGFIKTKRSIGHTMIVSGAIITGVTALLGVVGNAADSRSATLGSAGGNWDILSFNTGDVLAISVLAGIFNGALIGGINALSRKTLVFHINGQELEWRKARTELGLMATTIRLSAANPN